MTSNSYIIVVPKGKEQKHFKIMDGDRSISLMVVENGEVRIVGFGTVVQYYPTPERGEKKVF